MDCTCFIPRYSQGEPPPETPPCHCERKKYHGWLKGGNWATLYRDGAVIGHCIYIQARGVWLAFRIRPLAPAESLGASPDLHGAQKLFE